MARDKESEENLIAEMLEDFARLSGEDLGDILAEGFEEETRFREAPLHEGEDTIEDEFDSSSEPGDVDDYLDELFDDIDVPDDTADYYGDE
jgi:hypothetical protein